MMSVSPTRLLSVVMNNWDYDDGFYNNINCGDEAAQTVMECYDSVSWGFDTPLTCRSENFDSDPDVFEDLWYISFFSGPCFNFRDWCSRQGIPNRNQINNPYDFLAYVENEGVNVSAE